MKKVTQQYGDLARYVQAARLEKIHSRALTDAKHADSVGFGSIDDAISVHDTHTSGFSPLATCINDITKKQGLRVFDASNNTSQAYDPQIFMVSGFWNPATIVARKRRQRDQLLQAGDAIKKACESIGTFAGVDYDIKAYVQSAPDVAGKVYVPSQADIQRIQQSKRNPADFALLAGSRNISRQKVANHRGLELAQRLALSMPVELVPGPNPASTYKNLQDLNLAWGTVLKYQRLERSRKLNDVEKESVTVALRMLDDAQQATVPMLFASEVSLYAKVKEHLTQDNGKRPIALVFSDIYHHSSQAMADFANKDGYSLASLMPRLHR